MLGGTFDPIHHGHLRTAVELYERLAVAEVRLIPCHQPPHRPQPLANSAQRLHMVSLAIAGEAGLKLDACELERDQASWSVHTLADLRARLGPQVPLIMAIGMDSFLSLPAWYQWRQLTHYAHLVVVTRPDYQALYSAELQTWLDQHQTLEADLLQHLPCGKVLLMQLQTPLAISATQIRQALAEGRSARYWLPDQVLAYIQQQGLYL